MLDRRPLIALALLCASGCGDPPPVPSDAERQCNELDLPRQGERVRWLEDVTAASGITVTGHVDPQFPIGNGAAAGDLDGDGLYDLVVATGSGGPTRAYRNLGALNFQEITDSIGAPLIDSVHPVAFADLDNDGDPDLLLGGHLQTAFYENLGGQLAARASIANDGEAVSLDLFDADGDGLLDLAIGDGTGSHAFHNEGKLQFSDVTAAWSLAPSGQQKIIWAMTSFDFNQDGRPELIVDQDHDTEDPALGDPPLVGVGDYFYMSAPANQSTPPHYMEEASTLGLIGVRSSMGVVTADFNGDGRLDLYVSNIGRNPLFLLGEDGEYHDDNGSYGIGAVRIISDRCAADSRDRRCLLSSWGAALLDLDHDGLDDFIVLNGTSPDAQPASEFVGTPTGFVQVQTALGCLSGRTLLPVDLDGDGDLDLVVTTAGGLVHVLRNDAPSMKGWLRVRLSGGTSNRDGIGALVTATTAGGRKRLRPVGAGGVIYTFPPPEAHITTGGEPLSSLDVRWPSGKLTHLDAQADDLSLNRVLTIHEP